MDFKFHHIGYVVSDINQSVNSFKELGFQPQKPSFDSKLQVWLCYMTKEGCPLIELVQQLKGDSLETKLLSSIGVNPYHLCYEVADMEEACTYLKNIGYAPLFSPVPVSVLGNSLICYFHHPLTGYMEIMK